MNRAPQLSRPVRAGIVTGLAALAAVLTAAASRSGIGLTWDSIAYAYAAREVTAGRAPTTLTGAPFTQYPPGLPDLLGLLARLGPDVATVATVLGVVLVAVLVVSTHWLAGLALRDRTLALVPTTLVAIATPITMLYSRLWSEPLACVLTVVVLALPTRAVLQARLTWPTTVGVVALTSIAPWIRYACAVLVVVAAIGAGLALRRRGTRRAVTGAVLVGLASAAGTAALIVRNLFVGSGPLGLRPAPVDGLVDGVTGYLADTVTTLGSLVVPVPVADRFPAVTFAAGLVVAVLLAYGTARAVRLRDAAMAVLLAFVAVYWVFVLVSGRISFVEYMRYRLAAPTLVPLAVLATYAAREALRHLPPAARRAAVVALVGLVVLAGPIALAQSTAYAWSVGAHGHGYADRAVTGSPLAAAIQALPSNAHIVSNDPLATYWVTGRVVDRWEPSGAVPPVGTYIAIFDGEIAGTTRQTIAADVPGLDRVELTAYPDGRLYLVR